MRPVISVAGILLVVALCAGSVPSRRLTASARVVPPPVPSVRLLAVGDINLGRKVGQELLKGDTGYPFRLVQHELRTYDLVIGNLECQLSDQGGETQHPRNNLLFTGPPQGAASLKEGGITVVSTANNHALDYGIGALRETIANLNEMGILFSGTTSDGKELFTPLQFTVNGIRFGFIACTEIMNIEDRIWTNYVAEADTALVYPALRDVRPSVDILIVSYHGGIEYRAEPTGTTESFVRGAMKAGADLVLGHHPHVPQRIEETRSGGVIAYSLGNFVFDQPFDFWTRRGVALEVSIDQRRDGIAVRWYRARPLIAGNQPRFGTNQEDHLTLYTRTEGRKAL